MKYLLGVGVVGLGLVGIAPAQQIGTRGQLNQILSTGYEYTEAFEAYNIANGDAEYMNLTSLNSGSTVNGQGPGLVAPGATYSVYLTGNDAIDDLQWNGAGYFGTPTKDILSGGQGLLITYTMNVDAMGVDLSAFAGFADDYTAYVYDGANLVGTLNGNLANDGSSTFFGWENAGGITSVLFVGDVNDYSPLIDEHSYGYAPIGTPEPVSMAVLAFGGLTLLRRRRKV